jgi:hypothetical protein
MSDMFRRVRGMLLFVGLSLACTGIAGCGSKVSKGNYDKIDNGMTQQQVEDILGPGTATQSLDVAGLGAKNLQWKDGDKTINVTFMNGKVTLKQQAGL